jgi:hypothetical protein
MFEADSNFMILNQEKEGKYYPIYFLKKIFFFGTGV